MICRRSDALNQALYAAPGGPDCKPPGACIGSQKRYFRTGNHASENRVRHTIYVLIAYIDPKIWCFDTCSTKYRKSPSSSNVSQAASAVTRVHQSQILTPAKLQQSRTRTSSRSRTISCQLGGITRISRNCPCLVGRHGGRPFQEKHLVSCPRDKQQNTCYFQHRALDFSNESPCRDYRSQTKGN